MEHLLVTDILNPSIGSFLPSVDLSKVAATVAKSKFMGGGSGCTHNCYGFKLNTPSIIVASMYYIKDGFYIVDCFLCVISWIESS